MEVKRKVVTMRQIITEGRKATRKELELLFKNYVCSQMPDKHLSWMRDKELTRLVILAIYERNVNVNYRDHKSIVNLIRLSMPIGRSALYEYVAEIKKEDLD